ncbi:DUF3313 family protein [Lentisphaera profundi]|uniref:DUF3313 family protein n=1 Tax=Lentisphaera profundi TaxID=1658616 RepID=A0ABY7VQM7_9BACT|nr:DUF3313 family protein [Lentisphaera profundi]WDE95513.1 DUF3313 family protein [Lentisphaera profundi]
MKIILVVLIAVLLSSCGTSPASPTSFLKDPWKMEEGRNLQLMWKAPNAHVGNYTKFAFKPVGVTYMRRLGWWDKKNATSYQENDIFPGFDSGDNRKVAVEAAKIFDYEIRQAFLNDPQKDVRLVPHTFVDNETLLMEVQIIELVPIKKYLPSMGSVKGGSMAIEGKVFNGGTGELLMMFSDRRIENHPKTEMTGKLQRYSQVKPLSKEWCTFFARLANTGMRAN